MLHTKYGSLEKSSFVQHIIDKDRRIDVSFLKLIRNVDNCKFKVVSKSRKFN
jgi:hypothetical protein